MSGVHDDLATLRYRILEAMTGDATYWPDSAERELDAYVEAEIARLREMCAAHTQNEMQLVERCARLQQALREPCAECGHIDWRELG